MLRAFNGECDSAILKVRWNNIYNMIERIKKSHYAINKLGETHQIKIRDQYLDNRLIALRLTFEHQEKIHEAKDEQRRIREQIREEERTAKEIEEARAKAEKEEEYYQRLLNRAREELSKANGAEIDSLNEKIRLLQEDLSKAQFLKERAISLAQITRSGYVYIISNIGSFGDDVYKIGMTRRFEPSDRVRELSGASVPFGYDIHAMIYSKDAPELERILHKKFSFNRINLVNNRKEFFKVSLCEIASFANENGYDVEFSSIAEARAFRETCSIRDTKTKEEIENDISKEFPLSLNYHDDDDDDQDNDENEIYSALTNEVTYGS